MASYITSGGSASHCEIPVLSNPNVPAERNPCMFLIPVTLDSLNPCDVRMILGEVPKHVLRSLLATKSGYSKLPEKSTYLL